jgi:histidinol-phosphate aminotransferase
MGLLDYYKQFGDVDEEELNRLRRERRAHERQLALQQVPELDLSSTEWPEFPNSEVVNASIYTARGRVNGYPDRHAEAIRRALAERHGVEPARIVVGNGACELLQAAALALMSEGDELLTLWPSYPLYPLMAARAGGRPVTVEADGGAPHERLRQAVSDRTRLVVVCNPNDPTGAYLPAAALASLAAGLPESAHLLVDEALIHFQEVEEIDSVLRLTDAFPRVLVIRTFSKIYGLSGLRAGYAVGSSESASLLDAIAPVLGVNALTQAAVEQALAIGGPEVERRREVVVRERTRLLAGLRELPLEVGESQANFVWLRARGLSGLELAARLRTDGVLVAPGGSPGADDHIRAAVRDSAATDRLLAALRRALGRAG